MDHTHLNGRPRLLDQYGYPIQKTGEAVPGGIALPHGFLFLSRYSGTSHTYWHERFDEALRASRSDAEVMRHDTYLMSLMGERRRAVVRLPWHLEVPDEKDPFQIQVRDGLTKLIKGIPKLRRMLIWWSEAVWYGRFGVQVQWKWQDFDDRAPDPADVKGKSLPTGPAVKPKTRMRKGLTVACGDREGPWPVNGDKIGFQYDHTPYILVGAQAALDLKDAELLNSTMGGRGLALRGSWRDRFLLHKYLQDDASFFAADRAGGVHGVGVRSTAYWTWFMRMEWLGNVSDFFSRVGLGVTVWKYQRGNDEALKAVRKAAAEQSTRAHIFVPVDPEDWSKQGTGVERLEVPTSGADALGKLIELADGWLERFIVGQEGSSRGTSSGIGNEASAEFQMTTKSEIIEEDATLLADSLTGTETTPGLVSVPLRCTYPEADFPVTWRFSIGTKESDKKVASGKTMVEMGVSIRADEFREAAGYSKPASGDEIVEPPEQEQPGQEGMPGATGGAEGGGAGNPLEALMGGAGVPADADAGDSPSPDEPQGEPQEQGDFLDALRASRRGAPLQYDRKHRLSSTQFDLPSDMARRVRTLSQDILDADLAEDGRELDPHVTCLFGLHTDDSESVRDVVESFGPVRMKFGPVSIFPASESGSGDVVKIGILSADLHRLHDLLAERLPHTKTHPVYQPHVTLGYVLPGKGQKYAGRHELEGVELELDHLTFSDHDRKTTEIKLRGSRDNAPLQHARVMSAVRHLRRRGRDDLAVALLAAHGRRNGKGAATS